MAFQKKRSLGQHFLKDRGIARRIAKELLPIEEAQVLEIGPGLGALSKELFEEGIEAWMVETDQEAVKKLQELFPAQKERILQEDFLKLDLKSFSGLIVTGNFPYSISSPLLVRMVEERDRVRKLVGMFQKEFADRIHAEPGTKNYGRISVLVQSFFNAEKLFHVEARSFSPPPRVRSSVIRLVRNEREELPCDEARFFRVVKQAFGQRRKTLRNALKGWIPESSRRSPFFDQRAEALSVEAFIELTRHLEGKRDVPEP